MIQYQNQYEQEQLEQQRQYEQYISENKDCPKPVAKRNQSATNGTSIIKTKTKYSTRSFKCIKTKGTVEKAAQNKLSILKKEWNIWKKLKNHKLS